MLLADGPATGLTARGVQPVGPVQHVFEAFYIYGAVAPITDVGVLTITSSLAPPGAGKSMLARRLTTILPTMTLPEALDITRIHPVAGCTDNRTAVVTTRPCRAPYHTLSAVGLIGGGQVPLPGEVSLAHHGMPFLDELPEFRRHVLEVLRQLLK